MKNLTVALTDCNRSNRSGIILRGIDCHKLAMVDYSTLDGLDQDGGQLVEVGDWTHDTNPSNHCLGVRFYRVSAPITRERLQEADGITWTNNLDHRHGFVACDSTMISATFSAAMKVFFRGEGLYGGVIYDGTKHFVARMWAYTHLVESELIDLVLKPVAIVDDPNRFWRNVGLKPFSGYFSAQFKGERWVLTTRYGDVYEEFTGQHPYQVHVDVLNRTDIAVKESRMCRDQALEHHPLWKWFRQQPDELQQRLCRGWWGQVPKRAVDFFGKMRPWDEVAEGTRLVSLINSRTYVPADKVA